MRINQKRTLILLGIILAVPPSILALRGLAVGNLTFSELAQALLIGLMPHSEGGLGAAIGVSMWQGPLARIGAGIGLILVALFTADQGEGGPSWREDEDGDEDEEYEYEEDKNFTADQGKGSAK